MKKKLYWSLGSVIYLFSFAALVWWSVKEPGENVEQINPKTPLNSPIHLHKNCGTCHSAPAPSILDKKTWRPVISQMIHLLGDIGVSPSDREIRELVEYYESNAPRKLPTLPYPTKPSKLGFHPEAIGKLAGDRPKICNVNIVDLNSDGDQDILVCDAETNTVSWIRKEKDSWEETILAKLVAPAHTEVFDFDNDGDLDIVVAVLGHLHPSDEKVGAVSILINDGNLQFTTKTLLKNAPRVSDVQPGDFDQDGDIDFVVAMFGWRKVGGIGWLEQKPDGQFELHPISNHHGCIHVPTIDLNQDGRLDFIALISQEHERIEVFLNLGNGKFESHTLFDAENPNFGSSGIQLVDLDQDGDKDILFSNGDAFDTLDNAFKPYHGIQWLENKGNLKFVYHDLYRAYGIYRAIAEDMDQDGDLDIVAVSLFNNWSEKERPSIFWLENNGQQNFQPRRLATQPTHLVTAGIGDLNGDGLPDVVAGGMHVAGELDRKGRITLWTNLGENNQPRKGTKSAKDKSF